MREAVYIPNNRALDDVLATLPHDLRRYGDCVRFLLHTIAVKRWLGDAVDGWARLHSAVLRRNIPGRAIAPLRAFLVGRGVVETSPYRAGWYSTGYRIVEGYDGPPRRMLLTDRRLIAKRRVWRESFVTKPDSDLQPIIERRRAVLEAMRGALDGLTLDKSAAELVRELTAGGVNHNHAAYVCGVIEHRDHDGLLVDLFGYRVHSIVTRVASGLRPHLRLEGRALVELDVASSQPLILAALFLCPEKCASYGGSAHHIGRVLPVRVRRDALAFGKLCEKGTLYEFLQKKGNFRDREQVKRLLFRDVLFCRPYVRGRMTELFEQTWPGVFAAVQELKRTEGYKAVSRRLQRLESSIIIDGVCRRLVDEAPGLPFLTVHDSVLTWPDEAETVERLIVEAFEQYGVRPMIRRKGGETIRPTKNNTGILDCVPSTSV